MYKLTPREEQIASHWETGIMRDMIPSFIDQYWLNAAYEGINSAELPPEQSRVSWFIGLASNMLAFAACFYPPAAVIGVVLSYGTGMKSGPGYSYNLDKEALREQNLVRANAALSILGNGLNLANQISQYPGNDPSGINAKNWLKASVAAKADQLKQVYLSATPDWVRRVMIPTYRVLQSFRNLPGGFTIPDWAQQGGVAAVQRQKFVWENLVFPEMAVPFDARGSKILEYNMASMQAALVDFKRQYEKWRGDTIRSASGSGLLGAVAIPGLPRYEEYAKKHPFEPILKFPNLPVDIQKKLHSDRGKIAPLIQKVQK